MCTRSVCWHLCSRFFPLFRFWFLPPLQIMDELVDELSGTTIDGDINKVSSECSTRNLLKLFSSIQTKPQDVPMKLKNQKFINRTASIISRSKLLILSDSESEDEVTIDKRRFSKYLHISKPRNSGWRSRLDHSKWPTKGKRKRNSGSDNVFASTSGTQPVKNLKTKSDSMEIECKSSSSSDLSDSCPTDGNFDGDDEQSDFYDSSVKPSITKNRILCHKPKFEFKIPGKPVNPFFNFDFETHLASSPNSNLWKRRRPTHWISNAILLSLYKVTHTLFCIKINKSYILKQSPK